MTRRDMLWRAAGGVLGVGACLASALDAEGSPWSLVYFLAAIAGIVLVLNGKRIAVMWRAERQGHCHTAAAVHSQRVRRRHRRTDQATR